METNTSIVSLTQQELHFTMRGESMTRIETFVAAAMAFATTMLVISIGSIPDTFEDFVIAVKSIPSFVASSATIIWIWYSHADWSRRYGLEDRTTIIASSALICVVLVYIYPLRLMMQGLFYSISGGYFPIEMAIGNYVELRFLFCFYAFGFTLISLTFLALYHHSHRLKEQLALNSFESFYTTGVRAHWLARTVVCALVLLTGIFAPDSIIFFTPYIYFLLFPVSIVLARYQRAKWKRLSSKH